MPTMRSLLLLIAAMPLPGQDRPEMRWQLRADGSLWVQMPDPQSTPQVPDVWHPMFPRLHATDELDQDAGGVIWPIFVLPLLLTGDDGGAANGDAARRRRMLGIDVPALEVIRQPRDAAVALRAGLRALPQRFDVLLGLDSTRLPAPTPLLATLQVMAGERVAALMREQGGAASPAQRLTAPLAADAAGQLPLQVAALCGNWRVDHALIAWQCGQPDRVWCHLGGYFQPTRIAAGLHRLGFEVQEEGNTLRAAGRGWQVRADSRSMQCWQRGFLIDGAGAHAQNGAALRLATQPAWLFAPAGSAWPERLGVAAQSLEMQLELPPTDLRPIQVVATANCSDAAGAAALLARFAGLQRARNIDLEAHVEGQSGATWREIATWPPGTQLAQQGELTLRMVLQRTRAVARGTTVQFTFEVSDFDVRQWLLLTGRLGDLEW